MDFNKLADSTVKSGFYAFSFYAIFLLILVSASTEGVFLFVDTIHPLIGVWQFSGIITIFFVAVIEGLNYFALKTGILAQRDNNKGWWILLLVYVIAKIVSLTISVGGAIEAVEIRNVTPYEMTQVYKDSITNYYQNRIAEVASSPHDVNASNISKLEKIISSILAEIENIKKDKRNYTSSNEFLWTAQQIVKKKEKQLEQTRSSMNKIISNDTGIKNASAENDKLRNDLKTKLSEIDGKKSVFDGSKESKYTQAWLVIGMIEFFSLILNVIRTYTGIYKTPSEKDILRYKEKDLKESEKQAEIESRIKVLELKKLKENDSVIQAKQNDIIQGYKNKTINKTNAKRLIGQLYGSKEINEKKFMKMIANDEIRQYNNK